MYNFVPVDIKPLVGAVKLHYADAFDSDFALLLRERKSSNLPAMFQDALEVESNMMESDKIRQKMETRKFQETGLLPLVLPLMM